MIKHSPRLDRISLLASIVVVVMTGLWVLQQGQFNAHPANDVNVSWHYVRASGMVAYILLTLSVIWGLALSTRAVKDWSPGVLSMLLHTTLSWLAIAFGLLHAVLLLLDKYYPYQWSDIFIPFTGPYRPLFVGLGTLSFWLLLIIAISFQFKSQIGHATWKRIHLLSYVAFLLITVHGLFSGTDASKLGFQIIIISINVLVIGGLIGRWFALYRHQPIKPSPAK